MERDEQQRNRSSSEEWIITESKEEVEPRKESSGRGKRAEPPRPKTGVFTDHNFGFGSIARAKEKEEKSKKE